MKMRENIILIHNAALFSHDLYDYLKEKHANIKVLNSEGELIEMMKDFSGTIIINSFPDKYRWILESADPGSVKVLCCVPVGNRDPLKNGLPVVSGIFRFLNNGDAEFLTEKTGIDSESLIREIFGEIRLTEVDKDDINLLAAELIIRPMVLSLITGRLLMEGEKALISEPMKEMALPVYSRDIGLARDAIRFNPFSSDCFTDIERKLREVWNDLSNY